MTACTIMGATARNPQQYAVDAENVNELYKYIFERQDLLVAALPRLFGSRTAPTTPSTRRRLRAGCDVLVPACLFRRKHACLVPLQTKAPGNADPCPF